MKKYVIKTTSRATDSNINFKGTTAIYFYGKGEEMLAKEGTYDPQTNFNRMWYTLDNYGYTRECDAKRSWIYKHPESISPHWAKEKVEVIEVDFTEDELRRLFEKRITVEEVKK